MHGDQLRPKNAESFVAPISSVENRRISFDSVLYLTADPELFRAQLSGKPTGIPGNTPLLNEVSTDQIIRISDMLTDDMKELGRRALRGLPDSYGVQEGGLLFAPERRRILVAGERFGRGSSREQAVWALMEAGIGAVAASSFGPIFEKNAANIGLMTTTNLTFLDSFDPAIPLDRDLFLRDKDPLTREIIQAGGLFPYLKGIKAAQYTLPGCEAKERDQDRPMTIVEKRITKAAGIRSIKAGETVLLPVDMAYTYVGLSGLARQALAAAYGSPQATLPPDRIRFFEDHFAHSRRLQIPQLTQNQRQFALELRIPPENYYRGRLSEGGGSGISHRVMVERIDPRIAQVVIATDSHTPTIGSLPILGLPVGSTLFAAGIGEECIPFSTPSSTRVELTGKIPPGHSIRDVQLELALIAKQRDESTVIEFGGRGLDTLSFEQVAALCNMVPEIFNAEIAVTEIFRGAITFLQERYGLSEQEIRTLYVQPDAQATYDRVIKFDMNTTTPWIALPGNPNNTISLRNFTGNPQLQKAFLVSCTLGLQDLKEAAAAIKEKHVYEQTQLIVIPSSDEIRKLAETNGYLEILRNAGASIVNESACGPCIGEGLGAIEAGETAVSASNRNFPGRMGEKSAQVYLAGSILTALSATFGRIPTAEEYTDELPRIIEELNKLD